MKEKDVINQPTIDDELVITEHRDDVSTGIIISPQKVTVNVKVPVDKIYVALSGDQCAITNIRIYS